MMSVAFFSLLSTFKSELNFVRPFLGLLEMNGIEDIVVEEEEDFTGDEDAEEEAAEVETKAELDAISLCQINLIKDISMQWARNSKNISKF